MKQTFMKSFVEAKLLFARCLTLLILALLSTNLAWGEDDYSFTIQTSDFNTTSYDANNGSHDFTATCTTDESKTMTIACTSNQVYQNSSVMQWQSGKGYIYNTTDLGTIKSVVVNSTGGTFTTYYGTTEHPTSGTTVGNGFFTVQVDNATGKTSSIVVTFTPAKPFESLAVSGTPNKTNYKSNEEFDPAGLVVTGTYDDASEKTITSGITWNVTPSGALTVGTTSVSVTATVSGITSPAYVVNGLTVEEFVQTYANTYTSNVTLSAEGGTSASTAKVKWKNVEYDAIKAGTGSVAGACVVTIPANTKTLHFHAAGWNGETVVLNETINLVADAGVSGSSPFTLENDPETKDYFTLDPQGATSITFTVTSGKRFVLFGVNAESAPVTRIEVTGTPESFFVGDEFNHNGITVTAYYEDETTGDVTSSATFTGYDMATAGEQTVTVTYGGKTTTYNIIVKTIANTKETAYTTAEAIAIIDAKPAELTTIQVYVKGKVSKVDSYDDTHKSITYWLDNNAFEVYSGKGLNNTDFSSKEDIVAGADVIVYGKIKKYESTYEFGQDNYLVSYTAPTKTMPTITTTPTYKESLKVEESDEYTVEYDGDGELSITSSDEDVATAALDGSNVTITAKSAGTTTITISAAETDQYYGVSKEYTLRVIAPASLPFAFDGGKDDIETTAGMSQTGLGSDYTSSSPKLKFDTGNDTDGRDNIVIWFNGQADYVSYDIKGNDFSGGTFDVMESADGNTYTSVASYTALGSTKETETNALKSTTRYVKFVYTKKDKGNVALGNIKIGETYPVSITNAKYATLGLPYAVEIPDGVSAYTATVSGSTVTMTKISGGVIPANCGVILYAETPATYTFTKTTDVNPIESNQLVAALGGYKCTEADEGLVYYLGTVNNGKATFKKLNKGGTIAAGKAYLKLDAALPDGAKLEVTFGEPTGINTIDNEQLTIDNSKAYNLNGMRVNGSYKGIVIMNGKKYINK